MPIAQLFVFIAFGCWLFTTILIIGLQLLNPEPVHGKLRLSNPRHLLMIACIMSWLSMWCFRSMY